MPSSTLNKLQQILSISDFLSNGIEKDLIKFLINQESCRLQWKKAENELSSLKNSDIPLRDENRSLAVQLDLARNQLDGALRKRPMYEKRIQLLEQQLQAISALLNDMDPSEIKRMDKDTLLKMTSVGPLNDKENSAPSPSSQYHVGRKSVIPSDFDASDDETIHTHLVRAASNAKSFKRKINACDLKNTFDTKPTSFDTKFTSFDLPIFKKSFQSLNEEEPANKLVVESHKEEIVKKELPKPSISTQNNNINDKSEPAQVEPIIVNDIIKDANLTKLRNTPNIQPSAPSWQSHPAFVGDSLPTSPLYPDISDQITVVEDSKQNSFQMVSKPHNMIQKKEIKPGHCSACRKGIGFQKLFYRCQDCNIKCHEECKGLISTTCHKINDKMILDDLVSSSSQIKVPMLIVDIIKEIEKRGLSHQGLYRISGSVKEIKELKTKWLDHSQLNLSKINDVHVLTGVLKSYLKAISEPLITRQYHSAFLQAADKNDLPKIYKLIDNLPVANRHTLAYIILHLRKVARVQDNLMDFKSLARVLGPTIVGNGCLNPTNAQLYEESRFQPLVLEVLFGISEDYWNLMLANKDVNTSMRNENTVVEPSFNNPQKTVQEVSHSNSPLLGHISSLGDKARHLPRRIQPIASKPFLEKLGKKKFFDTPTLQR